MSTLSIPTPRTSSASEVDARFDALVRCSVPAQRDARTAREFETVFDLDYGQPVTIPAPVSDAPRSARRVRAVVRPRPVAARVRLTRRGRLVAVLSFLGIALAVMTAMGGWATATLDAGTPTPVRVIQVGPGDTLYGIAADLAEPGEIRSMVLRIQELNSLPDAQIAEGQKLAVPRG
ncbi:MAG: Peptidoglycan-binding LysM [Marmoricola sp.]|nr:Peptidoglycan-binding LysM [Marmoricola sp.]